METPAEQKNIYEIFRFSVLLKGAVSLAEIIVGLLVFVVPPAFVANLLIRLLEPELVEHPGNLIATGLLSLADQLALSSTLFIAFYLLSRGAIKLALVVALLKNKLWAYPSSLVVLGLFVLYQLYQIFLSHSLIIVGLTAFDLFVMYFIWKEYLVVKKN